MTQEHPPDHETDAEVRRDYDRLLSQESEIMELLGTIRRERMMHDFRNALNERDMLREVFKRIEPE